MKNETIADALQTIGIILLIVSSGVVGYLIFSRSSEENVVPNTRVSSHVDYFCHNGRAIYTYKNVNAGGIAIVENAYEC